MKPIDALLPSSPEVALLNGTALIDLAPMDTSNVGCFLHTYFSRMSHRE